MASAMEPRTGMKPMASPIFLLPRSSVHLPNAPMGPAPVARPSANSPMTPVEPMRMTQMKYGMRNVMPPQMETMMGKRQMLPMPTAEPMQARIKPHLDLKPSRCVVACLSAITFPSNKNVGFDCHAAPGGPGAAPSGFTYSSFLLVL